MRNGNINMGSEIILGLCSCSYCSLVSIWVRYNWFSVPIGLNYVYNMHIVYVVMNLIWCIRVLGSCVSYLVYVRS